MKTAFIVAIVVFGGFINSVIGATNVVFKKTLADGREVEIRETVVLGKEEKIGTGIPGSFLIRGGPHIGYEMFVGTCASNSLKVWATNFDLVAAQLVDESRCRFLDVVANGSRIAVLYTSHVGVLVDTVDVHGEPASNSHLLCTTLAPAALSVGRLVWFDSDIYILFKIGSAKVVFFLLPADGQSTRMKLQPEPTGPESTTIY
jgi:hypothetical protein